MPPSQGAPSHLARTTKVIAVADVVESVRLMEQDEQAFIQRWQSFVGFVQRLLPGNSGRLHKSLGDGLMLEFADPEGCVRAAVAMRDWFARANEGVPPQDQVQLRIGAHVAGFVADAYDIYGTDVNVAARIASLAGPGEIVITAALRERLGAALRAQLQDLGWGHLKHVKDPVHVFRLGQAGSAPVLPMHRFHGQGLRANVAVLPFTIDGDAPGELSGEALADGIVAALAPGNLLQVVSRLSTLPLAGGQGSLEDVRRTVGAHYVLAGRGHRQGAELALFVELVDAASAHVVWAHSFQSAVRQGAPNEPRLIHDIVCAVHGAVMAHETERSRGQPFPALEGFTLLLAAIGLMHWLSPAETERARGMLEHLAERGRGQVAPHAWLAHLHLLGLRIDGADAQARQGARECAALALQCDPGSPLALSMQGQACVYADHDLVAAEDCYAQALTVRPEDGLALLLQGELLALQGRGGEAMEATQRAEKSLSLEPLRWWYDGIAAFAALVAGDAAEAISMARRSVRRNPRFAPALRTLAVAHVRAGELAQAQQTVQRWAAREPDLSLAKVRATAIGAPAVMETLVQSLRDAGVPE
jgi:adenylate cyclase